MIQRPAFSQIFSTLYTDVSTSLGNVPLAKFSVLGALTLALSRALDGIFGYVDSQFRQSVPWSATGSYLESWAAMWGVTRKSAASASGSATLVCNGPATIPSGSVLVGSNNISYITSSPVVLAAAGTVVVALTTQTTGNATNLPPGAVVTLTTPVANVSPAGSIVSMTGGVDPETDSALQSRAQQQRSSPPQGGAAADYVEWAEQVPQVTRAWCLPTPATPGTVIVYIMCDNNNNNGFPIGTNGTATQDTRGPPATGDMLAAANQIYLPGNRPTTAFVQVVAPVPFPINFVLTGTQPLTTAAQTATTQAIVNRFLQIGTPLGMVVQESDVTLPIQQNLTNFNIVSPASAVTIPTGALPVIGSISFA